MNPRASLLPFLFALISSMVATSAGGADLPWRIGLATVKITPEQPVLMYGYASRTEPHQGIASDLFAKALAIEDGKGARAVLVTCDLGGVHGSMIERLAARLQERHGLPRAAVIYNASHTHAGPQAWLSRDEIDGVSPETIRQTRTYIAALEQKLEQVAHEALARLEPAALTWGLGMAPFVMNRREFTDRGIVLGFNPKGPVDRSVLVLRASDGQGRLRAVLMGVACHCTCSGPKNQQIDGDYAGQAQRLVETQFPGTQAMFLTGCGGDANPWPRGEISHARQHGATLAAEVTRVLTEKLAPLRPPLRMAFSQAALPITPPESREKVEAMAKSSSSWIKYIGTRQLALLNKGQAPAASYPMPISLWHFGTDLALVGLSGEPVNDYLHLIERAIGPTRLWVAGYCHDVFGYVPSARVLAEGGYETRGIDRGDAVGQFAPAAQEVVVGTVTALARATGRLP